MSDGHDGGDHGPDYSGHAGSFDHGGAGHNFDLGHLAAGLGATLGVVHRHQDAALMPERLVPGRGGWAFGYASHALAQMGCIDSACCTNEVCDEDTGVRLPGVLFREESNNIQLLVWPHGEINTQTVLRNIASRNGLVSLSRRVRGLVANTKHHASLLDTKLFDGPGKGSHASASFPGATGSTVVWNEFWQRPSKKHWWSNTDIDVGPPVPSHIVITGYTWFFEQTGDYETRIAISVTNPKTCIAGQWVPINEEPVRQQMIVAKRVALDLFEALTKIKPAEYAVILRQIQDRRLPNFNAPEYSNTIADSHRGPGPGPVPQSVRAVAEPMKFDMAGG